MSTHSHEEEIGPERNMSGQEFCIPIALANCDESTPYDDTLVYRNVFKEHQGHHIDSAGGTLPVKTPCVCDLSVVITFRQLWASTAGMDANPARDNV